MFLLMYRNTPHCTTNVSPAMLLMGRKLRDKIPSLNVVESVILEKAKKEDEKKKGKSKKYYDNKRNVKKKIINVGDYVLVKQHKKGKFLTNYETNPVKVVKVNGSAITVSRDDKEITRNITEVVKVNKGHESEEFLYVDDNASGKEDTDGESEYGNDEENKEVDDEGIEDNKVGSKNDNKESFQKEKSINVELRRSSRKRKPPEKLTLYVRD